MPRRATYSNYNIEEQSVLLPDSRLNPLKESNNNNQSTNKEADSHEIIDGTSHATSKPIPIPTRQKANRAWQPAFFVGSPSDDPGENPTFSRRRALS